MSPRARLITVCIDGIPLPGSVTGRTAGIRRESPYCSILPHAATIAGVDLDNAVVIDHRDIGRRLIVGVERGLPRQGLQAGIRTIDVLGHIQRKQLGRSLGVTRPQQVGERGVVLRIVQKI